MDEEWIQTFNDIKKRHDESYKIIEMAIRNEEMERSDLALINYKMGITLIDEALSTPVSLPEKTDETWEIACKMIHKMKQTRAEVLMRIGSLTKTNSNNGKLIENDFVDVSETATASVDDCGGSVNRPRTYHELALALEQLKCDPNINGIGLLELLFSCHGVRLYHIQPNGEVITSSDDSILRIVRIGEDTINHLAPTIFLQVIKTSAAINVDHCETKPESSTSSASNSNAMMMDATSPTNSEIINDVAWIYPLVPSVSPCFRTDYGAFILPDLQSNVPGAAIGIFVPEGADEIVVEILEAILHGIVKQTTAGVGELEPEANLSTTVSHNLVKGAYYISMGLIHGAKKAGEVISYGTPMIINKLNKAPSDAPETVPENVRNGMEIAKNVSEKAGQITGYIAGQVGSATMALGRFLAPHIQKHGSTLLSKGFGISEDKASEQVKGALTIAAGAVEGFGTVYSGLEQSSVILGKNISNNTVKIIEHKYGGSAGLTAESTFDTVGNVINISHNMNWITPKGLVKRTAKDAGKAIVQDFKPKIIPGNNYVPASALYPDLSGFAKEITKIKEKS